MNEFEQILSRLEQAINKSEPTMSNEELLKALDERIISVKEKQDGYRQVAEKPKNINIVDISPAAVKKLQALLGGKKTEETQDETQEIDYKRLLKELQESLNLTQKKGLVAKLGEKLKEFTKNIIGQVFKLIGNVIRWTFSTITSVVTGLADFLLTKIKYAILGGAVKGAAGMGRTTLGRNWLTMALRGTALAGMTYGAMNIAGDVKAIKDSFTSYEEKITSQLPGEDATIEEAFDTFTTSSFGGSLLDQAMGEDTGDDPTMGPTGDLPPIESSPPMEGESAPPAEIGTMDADTGSGEAMQIKVMEGDAGQLDLQLSRPLDQSKKESLNEQEILSKLKAILVKRSAETKQPFDVDSQIKLPNINTPASTNITAVVIPPQDEPAPPAPKSDKEKSVQRVMESTNFSEEEAATLLERVVADGEFGDDTLMTADGMKASDYYGTPTVNILDDGSTEITGDPNSPYAKSIQPPPPPPQPEIDFESGIPSSDELLGDTSTTTPYKSDVDYTNDQMVIDHFDNLDARTDSQFSTELPPIETPQPAPGTAPEPTSLFDSSKLSPNVMLFDSANDTGAPPVNINMEALVHLEQQIIKSDQETVEALEQTQQLITSIPVQTTEEGVTYSYPENITGIPQFRKGVRTLT